MLQSWHMRIHLPLHHRPRSSSCRRCSVLHPPHPLRQCCTLASSSFWTLCSLTSRWSSSRSVWPNPRSHRKMKRNLPFPEDFQSLRPLHAASGQRMIAAGVFSGTSRGCWSYRVSAWRGKRGAGTGRHVWPKEAWCACWGIDGARWARKRLWRWRRWPAPL